MKFSRLAWMRVVFAAASALVLLPSCATRSTPIRSTYYEPIRKESKRNDVATSSEIASELKSIRAPLKGPLTNKRLDELANPKPTILSQLTEQVTKRVGKQKGFAKKSSKPARVLASNSGTPITIPNEPDALELKTLTTLEDSKLQLSSTSETPLIFDIPVTYNQRVSFWIQSFQSGGSKSFRTWLERSERYVPFIQAELEKAGLPQDLVYIVMIESGFRPDAVSHMSAMGLWQFMPATGRQYGLNINWWLDERRDFEKSTRAAIAYIRDLYRQFDSWYLIAASYNMGENAVRKLVKRHGTNDFWKLADRGVLPRETTDYVPKILAAMLIAKAPGLYGFRDLNHHLPLSFEYTLVPGGTDLINLAEFLGVSEKHLQELNPELMKGFVPREAKGHRIRVPKGS
ncbi:MAG: lytic transglycosylase domain-containing protein, partial [Bdellovibrionota bacterium]